MALADKINALSKQIYPVGMPEQVEQVKLQTGEKMAPFEDVDCRSGSEGTKNRFELPPVYGDMSSFHFKHRNADSDEDFETLVADYSSLCKKYNYDKDIIEALILIINDIERRTIERREKNTGERR